MTARNFIFEMNKNEILTLEITEINNMGCGVGKTADGIVVFVSGAVTGDTIEARVIKVNKTYLVGRLERVIKPSPFRNPVPFCEAANGCGGCVYRHVTMSMSLK